MKQYLLILALISLFLIAACAQQASTNEGAADSGAAMKVPVPGNEDVEEMVVEDGSEAAIEEPPGVPADKPVDGGAMPGIPSLVEIDIIAEHWKFDPGTITVKEGQKVKLNIKSTDVTHGFALPDFGVSQRLEPGKEVTVEFTFNLLSALL